MSPSRVETWVWVLVYGGLLMTSIGIFVFRGGDAALGWVLIALGVVAAVAGAALVVVRARMTPQKPPPQKQPPQPPSRPPTQAP